MRLPTAILLAITGLTLVNAAPAKLIRWQVEHARSAIGFSGSAVGEAFSGRFLRWNAVIEFDPARPEQGRVVTDIELASARISNPSHQKALSGPEWLDSGRARFRSTKISRTRGNAYVALGTLTMRGKTVPVRMPFTLAIKGGEARMRGALTLNRMDWDVGKAADPTGRWVPLNIPVEINLVAHRR